MNEEGEEGVYCHGCHVLILDNRSVLKSNNRGECILLKIKPQEFKLLQIKLQIPYFSL